MPRGKRTVYGLYCPETGDRLGSIRFHKQNSKGVAWRDNKLTKYSPRLRKRVQAKLKEEKHSS